MPTARCGDVDCYYDVDGDGELVVFVPDAGFGAWLWGWQHAAVAGPFEAIVWDLRGTGRSDSPPGPYSVRELAADLEAVLSHHGARRAHVVGAGLGGAIALQYALDHGRARTLSLFGTTPGGSLAPSSDELCASYAPRDDPDALRSSLLPHFSEAFADEQPDVLDGIVAWRREDDADEAAWRAQAAAIDDVDVRDRLHELTIPALVVHGTDDRFYPIENARLLADGLPNARLELVDGGSHLAFVEQSRYVNDLLLGFLETNTDADRS